MTSSPPILPFEPNLRPPHEGRDELAQLEIHALRHLVEAADEAVLDLASGIWTSERFTEWWQLVRAEHAEHTQECLKNVLRRYNPPPATYDCPACKTPGSLTIAMDPSGPGQAVAIAMMGAVVRVATCSACEKTRRLMPGMSDQEGLRTFARAYAPDAGLGMEPGRRYRIVWRSSLQRKDHESVLDFLGRAEGTPAVLAFSARPLAGTQRLEADWIKSVTEVPKDTKIVLDLVRQ